jgi:hypothetical protein
LLTELDDIRERDAGSPILPSPGRDPCLARRGAEVCCFFTAVERLPDRYALYLDVTTSRDLRAWTTPARAGARTETSYEMDL